MPEGEHSWQTSKGPRKRVSCRLTAETYLLLHVAARGLDLTPTALATEILERWTTGWLERNRTALTAALAEERSYRRESEGGTARARGGND